MRACDVDAIDFDMQAEEFDVEAGAILVSVGFQEFDARALGNYGYGRLANVVTSLELERLLNASGVTQGHVIRPSDQRTSRRIEVPGSDAERRATRDLDTPLERLGGGVPGALNRGLARERGRLPRDRPRSGRLRRVPDRGIPQGRPFAQLGRHRLRGCRRLLGEGARGRHDQREREPACQPPKPPQPHGMPLP